MLTSLCEEIHADFNGETFWCVVVRKLRTTVHKEVLAPPTVASYLYLATMQLASRKLHN